MCGPQAAEQQQQQRRRRRSHAAAFALETREQRGGSCDRCLPVFATLCEALQKGTLNTDTLATSWQLCAAGSKLRNVNGVSWRLLAERCASARSVQPDVHIVDVPAAATIEPAHGIAVRSQHQRHCRHSLREGAERQRARAVPVTAHQTRTHARRRRCTRAVVHRPYDAARGRPCALHAERAGHC